MALSLFRICFIKGTQGKLTAWTCCVPNRWASTSSSLLYHSQEYLAVHCRAVHLAIRQQVTLLLVCELPKGTYFRVLLTKLRGLRLARIKHRRMLATTKMQCYPIEALACTMRLSTKPAELECMCSLRQLRQNYWLITISCIGFEVCA